MWPDATRILLLSVGGITMLLGLALWSLDMEKRANRAFAALLGLKGGTLLLSQVPFLAPGATAFAFAVMPYLILPLVPVALYFASVFPRRRGPLGRPGAGWWVLAAILGLWGLYFGWHDLFWSLASGAPPHPALWASSDLHFAAFGPLSLLLWLSFPVFAALALVFVHDYTTSHQGPQRTSHFLIGTGFMVNGIFDGVRQTTGLVTILGDPAGYPFAPWGWAAAFLPSLSVVPAALALALMFLHHFRSDPERGGATGEPGEGALERRAYVLAVLALLAGLLPTVVPMQGLFDSTLVQGALASARLVLPIVVTYGLLRYSLFDIDIRVRKGIGYTLFAGTFGATFLIGSELVEGRVAERFGDLGGLAAAGGLALFSLPLNRLTQNVAKRIMPGSVSAAVPAVSDVEALYAAQYAMLTEDGQVTTKERRCLDELRARIGLSARRAARLETAHLETAGMDTVRSGPRPAG